MDRITAAAVLIVSIIFLPSLCMAGAVEWEENFSKAMKNAAETHKAIFADFTGREN